MNILAAMWKINSRLVKYRQTQTFSRGRFLAISPKLLALYLRKLRHRQKNYLLKNIKLVCESQPGRFPGLR